MSTGSLACCPLQQYKIHMVGGLYLIWEIQSKNRSVYPFSGDFEFYFDLSGYGGIQVNGHK